ncbi:LAMI_0E15544g1_1 [Lachancea mirantina]|uniref:LAMI_0E15544g1_1 n=1 Tax=Lachancea mirantina TaxID=1230905 RepID=A0A1G4JSF1_9SACH|nr:LAMI_0E15544g1_1 [Lachancea mirantina]
MTDYETKENELSFASTTRASLQVRGLSVLASTGSTIVNNISLNVPSGSILAIMGGSGCGKTTLLNALACKNSRGLQKNGILKIIPENAEKTDNKVTTAYLTQHDILASKLTCRETLNYAADLKSNSPKQERRKLVEELIAELGLKDCADTFVGDRRNPGLSGGEKRRLSIGIQLISNPSLMFLDEPTTGLDAYSAYVFIKTLRKLSHTGGRTFVMSIHQPRADILFLLDQVCILSQGQDVYCGPVNKMVEYFGDLGYEVPQHVNPADHFIDLCSIDSRTEAAATFTEQRLRDLIANWSKFEKALELPSIDYESELEVSAPSVSFRDQVKVLTLRSSKLNFRNSLAFLGILLEPVIIGVITGWIFYKPDQTTLAGLRTITGALYSAGALQGYLFLLYETYRLCEQDIKIYDRERAEGSVSALAFLLSRRLSNFFFEDLAVPFIFSVITFFMYGLNVNAKGFFIYFSVVFLIHQTSTSVAFLSVAISRDFSQASLFGNLNYTLQSMACGFFANAKKLPVYVRWTKYIAYLWYSYGSLMSNEFTDLGCSSTDLDDCTGNMLLATAGYPRNWRTVPIVIIFLWALGFYVVGVVIFHINKTDVSLAKKIKAKKKTCTETKEIHLDLEANKAISSKSRMASVDFAFARLNLTVQMRDIRLGRRKMLTYSHKNLEILKDIDATFQSGVINAVMGPSGSGKSSLLNLVSGKLRSTINRSFASQGKILCGGALLSFPEFSSLCSFVPQDDEHLLSKLTVRETLSYAAELRLYDLNSNERNARVEELIGDLGLKHCENTLIGDDLTKGISGGEKRRVSMGIQLLTDPPIILLDEPTSGLDSYTAFKILDVLNGLCLHSGKTVVLTIHQPRAELFQKFGNVLLLAKGGEVAFNGSPLAMIHYFASLGHHCPPLTNVADFFLDLISLNTQNEENEANSRHRVDNLVNAWKISKPQLIENDRPSAKFEVAGSASAPFRIAYKVCIRRQFKTITRNLESLSARLAQIPGVGIILALFFAPIKHDYTSINNRLGLVQQSTALYFTGMLTNLACYPKERDYFYQEFSDNVYGVTPFLLGYMTIELPMALLASALYAIFTVLVCGLNRTAGNFFVTMYCSFIVATCGEALGIITNTLFEQPGFVVNVVSIILSIGTVMSGLMSLHMSKVLKGFNYLSPLNYTAMIMINYAFPSSLKLTCKDGGQNPDGSCMLSTGSEVLKAYELQRNTREYLGIIICVWFIYRFLGYLILRAKLEWLKW